jgi:hypothetical protein
MTGDNCLKIEAMKKLVILAMCAGVLVTYSCMKDYEYLNDIQSTETSRIPKPEPQPKDTVQYYRELKVNGNESVATVTAVVKDEVKATAKTYIREYRKKNGYSITSEQRRITPEFCNAHMSSSDINGGVRKEFLQEDTNIIYVDFTYVDSSFELNGETLELLADRVDTVKVYNLDEIATKAVVTDTIYNNTVVEFRLKNYLDEEYLKDETLERYYSYNVEDPVVPTTTVWELVANRIEEGYRYSSVDHIQLYSDGSRSLIKNYSVRIPVDAKVLSKWERIVKNYNLTTGDVKRSEPDKVAGNNGDGVYWTNYTYVYSNEVTLKALEDENGNPSNDWEVKEAREVKVKEDDNVLYSFSELESSVEDGGYTVMDKGDYADYTCTLVYTYGDFVRELVAPGKMIKAEEPPVDPVITYEWDEDSEKDEITDTKRTVSVDLVKFSDGVEVDRTPFEKSFPRTFKVLTDWTSTQESYEQSTSKAGYTTSSEKKVEGNWSFYEVVVSIKNMATLADGFSMPNEWKAEETDNIVVSYNGKPYTFESKTISVSDEAKVDENTGEYGDKLEYVFGGKEKYLTAPGQINIPAVPTIVNQYWDATRAKDELTNNNRVTSIYWMTEWSDGKKEEQFYELTSSRTLDPITNWTSTQVNFNESTNAPSYYVSGKEPDGKGLWSYNKTVIFIENSATLADGSRMNNGWEARELSDIVITRDGKSHTFSNKNISLSHSSSVSSDGKYTDILYYTFGENTKQSSAPGTIIKKSEEPKIKEVQQTICPTANKKGYIYTLIVRYDNGKSLPVTITDGSIATFEKVDNLDSRVNGMSISREGNWVLTIAKDTAEDMAYDTVDGHVNCQMPYVKAMNIGWDEGHTVDGHASVKTSRYSVSSDGKVSDTYHNNTVIGTISL